MSNKRIRKKMAKRAAAKRMAEEAEVFVEAAGPIVDVERQWEKKAENTVEEARILTEAESAVETGVNGKPFKPEKDMELLFDEVNASVEAANALDEGTDEADRHHLKHLDEADEPREWNPEAVIDEKIKEEQKAEEEQELRDQIVGALD